MVEAAAISTFTSLVLRLSDSAFKPMLWKLIGWAGDKGTRVHTVLSIALALASELKTLFLPYFSHLLKLSIAVLEGGDAAPLAVASRAVVLRTLRECFLHDGGSDFVTEERFKMLRDPIMMQLRQRDSEDDETYLERVDDLVAPCIGQFAGAAADVGMRKEINDGIVAFYNDARPAVRVGSLVATEHVYGVAGSVFISFLPDTLSLFTELLEDGDPAVESQARRLRLAIETELGETLDAYLGK